MPWFIMPPGFACFSWTVTAWPISARLRAAARPAGPAPITATAFPLGGNHGSSTTGACARKSAADRFEKQIATGSPRPSQPWRHSASQGREQTRPSTAGKTLS